MNRDIILDSFMLTLNLSGANSSVIADMWINKFYKEKPGKIYVFQCNEIDEKVRSRYKDEKVVWLVNLDVNFASIKDELKRLSADDIFIIFDAEKLVMSDENKSGAKPSFEENNRNYGQKVENWEIFSYEIDDIYNDYISMVKGIITICNVNTSTKKRF